MFIILKMVMNDDNDEEMMNDEEDKQTIDVDTYKKMVNMVETRPHKSYLEIKSHFYDKPQIPQELIKSHKNTFELQIK